MEVILHKKTGYPLNGIIPAVYLVILNSLIFDRISKFSEFAVVCSSLSH